MESTIYVGEGDDNGIRVFHVRDGEPGDTWGRCKVFDELVLVQAERRDKPGTFTFGEHHRVTIQGDALRCDHPRASWARECYHIEVARAALAKAAREKAIEEYDRTGETALWSGLVNTTGDAWATALRLWALKAPAGENPADTMPASHLARCLEAWGVAWAPAKRRENEMRLAA